MSAADMRKRAERLGALLAGFDKETNAAIKGPGLLTPGEWNDYLKALLKVNDGLRDARTTLAIAADRLDATSAKEGD
jgi:hypothetical protein